MTREFAHSTCAVPRHLRRQLFCACAVLFLAQSQVWGSSQKSRILVSSMFGANSDGWTVGGAKLDQPAFQANLVHSMGRAAEVSDHGDELWYFVAPVKFSGDKTVAYGGELNFKMHHSKTPPPSNSHLMRRKTGMEGADLLLEAECGHTLYLHHVFQHPKGVSTQYKISLHEEAGWIDSRNSREVTQLDLLGVLAHLKGIKIRGAFYKEPEAVQLAAVSLLLPTKSSDTLYPCCSDKSPVRIEVCRSKDASMTPKGTNFNCRGTLQPLVSITSIFPKFSRRSGGAVVTVTGENFGLTGSRSILRIGGKPAPRCSYPEEEFPLTNPPLARTFLAASCRNRVLDTGEDKTDCGGRLCEPCVQRSFPEHCTNRVLDTTRGETSRGYQPNSLGLIHDCGGPCGQPDHCCDRLQNFGETGLDCGGLDCLACSPLQRPVGTAVERQIIATGSCSADGCFCHIKEDLASDNACYEAVNVTSSQAWNGSCVPIDGTCIPCSNGIYLSQSDDVTEAREYRGKRIYLTGGVGSGQSATIRSYDPSSKLAFLTPWQAHGRFFPLLEPERNTTYRVGAIRVVNGGSGYLAGNWKLPSDLFETGQVHDEAFGTFSVGTDGEITEAVVVNQGRYLHLDHERLGPVSDVAGRALDCDCPANDRAAVLAVSWRYDEMVPPKAGTTYMILDEKGIEGSAWRNIKRVESVPQHQTLICETPEGDGHNQVFSVEAQDETGTMSTSCITESTRGFEFGAHDFIWSLQMSMRQAIGVRAIQAKSMAVNENNGDIYVVGQIVGTCFDDPEVGCMGLVGSHLPRRGIANLADFTPLILDPFGLTSAYVLKLNFRGVPLWLTKIDSSNRFGRVEPDSVRVDAKLASPRIYIAGLYSANRGSNIRFWHVDPDTRAPRFIPRAQAERGVGRCNVASCDGSVCTNVVPFNQSWQCDSTLSSGEEGTCGARFCAWLEGYDNAIESQSDAFVAAMNEDGRWQWATTRISNTGLGTTFVPSSVRMAVASGPIGSTTTGWEGGLYLAASIRLRAILGLATGVSDRPRQRLDLGVVSNELFNFERNASDLPRFELSVPRSVTDDIYAFVTRISEHGVIWARLFGPLGADGSLRTFEADTALGVYGSGVYLGTKLSYSSCAFQKLNASERGDVDSSGANVSNTACFPWAGIYAWYTLDSWQLTERAQWDDASGNGRHGVVTRGQVEMQERVTGHHPRRYLKGGAADGIQFPVNSVPPEFTLCSISRMATRGAAGVLEAVEDAAWVHGHVAGVAGEAVYGSAMTHAEILYEGASTFKVTDWLVMCGQNDPVDAIFNANGLAVGTGAVGGTGGRQLAINDGLYSAGVGRSEWEVIEIVIWNRYLTRPEIDAVVLHYRKMLTDADVQGHRVVSLPGNGVRNMFLFSMDNRGAVRWHREAIGGNLTATAMAVSRPEKRLGGRMQDPTIDLDFTPYVYVAGQAAGADPSTFGALRFPEGCLGNDPNIPWSNERACSGHLVVRGTQTDVFLAKYSAVTGEAIWLKRIGQRDILEHVVGMALDEQTGQLFLAGNYANSFTSERYRDVFDLVAAGRGGALGCPMDVADGAVKERLGRRLTEAELGTANCSFIKNSRSVVNRAAFVLSVEGGNKAHGKTSRPWSQCLAPEEVGCNADGVLWAKNLGSGTLEPATMAETYALGIVASRADAKASILAMGMFRGFVQATGTSGVKTRGVDDEGFWNCCLKLGIPNVLDQVQDSWESYIMTLGD